MKRTLFSLAMMLMTVITANAQLTQGHVTYSMDFSTDDPNMEMGIAMMEGSQLNMYFNGESTRADVAMGTMMSMTTISDMKAQEFLMLMDISMMGMKYAVHSTLEELEAMNDDEEEEPDFDIDLTNEKKKVLGYECKKAVLTNEEGVETVFWYTEEIAVNKKGQSYLNEKVPGFPLEYEMIQNGMKVTLVATDFVDSLKKKEVDALFSMDIPEGYEEKTMEELQQMGGGM